MVALGNAEVTVYTSVIGISNDSTNFTLHYEPHNTEITTQPPATTEQTSPSPPSTSTTPPTTTNTVTMPPTTSLPSTVVTTSNANASTSWMPLLLMIFISVLSYS
uniref:Uncharacterized protein n=1 Tax=Panagrolaimus sp. ES5 TaxID=591445 RepID=A0AC34FQ77_9BILA